MTYTISGLPHCNSSLIYPPNPILCIEAPTLCVMYAEQPCGLDASGSLPLSVHECHAALNPKLTHQP